MPSPSIRTVVVPWAPPPPILRTLLDVRSAVNRTVADWRAHPEESRFEATRRSYPGLRAGYPHLASSWAVTVCNEASAVLAAWDRSLRRVRAIDPVPFERMRHQLPRRRRLKASLHHSLFRLHRDLLDITIRPETHVSIDRRTIRHPLFWKYGEESAWTFGLTVTDSALLFHFRVPQEMEEPRDAAGVDLNFGSAVYASGDGRIGSVDLGPVLEVQRRMRLKRASIARRISKDLRHQRSVLRRYGRRERNRVTPLVHRAVNELLARNPHRALVLEDLTDATQTILRREPHRGPESRRALSAWTHGQFARIVSYKTRTPIVWVNPAGTSRECPQCGGRTALPTEEARRGAPRSRGEPMSRRTVCVDCGGEWHRDAAAAIAILARGCRFLRGVTVPPSARSALVEAARWRPGAGIPGLIGEPVKPDDAKSDGPAFGGDSG